MARGLNQFEVGTVAEATEVTGVSATPRGNDAKIQAMLADLKLRNRAQPLSYNTVTGIVRLVSSAVAGTATNTQYFVYRAPSDCVLDLAEVHVREVSTTSGFPEVTADAYLQAAPFTPGGALGPNQTYDPNTDATVVTIVPEQKIQAIAVNQSKGNLFPSGMFSLPVQNQFIDEGRWLVFRFVPPAYNGSSVEGWILATITLHFAEFHTS